MSVSVSWLRKETHSNWKALLISIFARLEQNKNKNKNLHSSERQQVENEGPRWSVAGLRRNHFSWCLSEWSRKMSSASLGQWLAAERVGYSGVTERGKRRRTGCKIKQQSAAATVVASELRSCCMFKMTAWLPVNEGGLKSLFNSIK